MTNAVRLKKTLRQNAMIRHLLSQHRNADSVYLLGYKDGLYEGARLARRSERAVLREKP